MNYKIVIEDFRSGVIDKYKWKIVIGNNGGYWSPLQPDTSQAEVDAMNRWYGKPGGYEDIVHVLLAVGVPAEWARTET